MMVEHYALLNIYIINNIDLYSFIIYIFILLKKTKNNIFFGEDAQTTSQICAPKLSSRFKRSYKKMICFFFFSLKKVS